MGFSKDSVEITWVEANLIFYWLFGGSGANYFSKDVHFAINLSLLFLSQLNNVKFLTVLSSIDFFLIDTASGPHNVEFFLKNLKESKVPGIRVIFSKIPQE